MHVPPTLVSFAVAACRAENIISNEFKRPGANVGLLLPEYGEDGLPVAESLRALFDQVTEADPQGRDRLRAGAGHGRRGRGRVQDGSGQPRRLRL